MTTGTTRITESAVEETALKWLENLGYTITSGASLMDSDTNPERSGCDQVILENRLKQALEKINPSLPPYAIAEAIRQIKQTFNPNPVENNRHFHRLLTDGITVPLRNDGIESHDQAWLLDLDDQLFKTFTGCKELLRQTPQQARNRQELRGLLRTPAGGHYLYHDPEIFPRH